MVSTSSAPSHIRVHVRVFPGHPAIGPQDCQKSLGAGPCSATTPIPRRPSSDVRTATEGGGLVDQVEVQFPCPACEGH